MNDDAIIETAPTLKDQRLLLISIFIIAGCSLIYELLISSLSTYLLGSGVIHYSLTIGLFLFFMGVGSWLAQHIHQHLLKAFIRIEIALGLVGGLSAILLYSAYAWTKYYYPAMLLVIAAISVLVGMEIPLLMRVIEKGRGIRQGLSDVLATDYVGALIASILFPFILLPYLGHLVTAFAVGAVNLLVALMVAWNFRQRVEQGSGLLAWGFLAFIALVITSFFSPAFSQLLSRSLYQDPVIYSQQSPYQQIIVTERGRDLRLFLNGSLQFSSIDEHRYHEPLVHLPASHSQSLERALIIGGGDGLAAKQLLSYESLQDIVVVDLDPAVTSLAMRFQKIRALNENALQHPLVTVNNDDAWQWLEEDGDLFDVIIIDLPDPDTADLARLYSVEFYRKIERRLAVGGIMITQASSPWVVPKAYWSIASTANAVFKHVQPVYTQVPSFGPWGYIMASNKALNKQRDIPANARYLTNDDWQFAFKQPSDLPILDMEENHLQTLDLMKYYNEGFNNLQIGE